MRSSDVAVYRWGLELQLVPDRTLKSLRTATCMSLRPISVKRHKRRDWSKSILNCKISLMRTEMVHKFRIILESSYCCADFYETPIPFHPVISSFPLTIFKSSSSSHLCEIVDSGCETRVDGSLLGVGSVQLFGGCNCNQSIGEIIGIGFEGGQIILNGRGKASRCELRLHVLHSGQGCLDIGYQVVDSSNDGARVSRGKLRCCLSI